MRKILGLDRGGRIAFRVDEQGVTLGRADAERSDPEIDGFLALLAKDIGVRPDSLAALAPQRLPRAREPTAGMTFDPWESIEDDVDL